MAIDLSKIDNLYIDEGTEVSPFILTDAEVTTLYKLACSAYTSKFTIKGYVNTVSGTILKYQSYQIKNTWPDLHILAQEVASEDWTVKLVSTNIMEGNNTKIVATNIAMGSLCFAVDPDRSSCTTRPISEVINLMHFDNVNGIISCDSPTSNLGWTATLVLKFWPEYDPTDIKYIGIPTGMSPTPLTVRAIAVSGVTITAASRIDESATTNVVFAASPTNHTKGENCKFSINVPDAYAEATPQGVVVTSTFSVTGRSFTEIVQKGGTVHEEKTEGVVTRKWAEFDITGSYYMFGMTEPSGSNSVTMTIENATFSVTCDKDALTEGAYATYVVNGYQWSECQKTAVIDETTLSGITAEELKKRFHFESSSAQFVMNQPTDNATFSAKVSTYIAPPGAVPTGDRAYKFDITLTAIGITSITLTPQTIGQGVTSTITLSYKPTTHTKGTITYGLTCASLTFDSKDDTHGIYKITSYEISTAGHDAITSVYSSYLGTTEPLLSATQKIYVQVIGFTVGFDESREQKSASIDENSQITCYVDILHLSELYKYFTVTISKGADLIDEDFILNRLHFSEDTSADWISFDAPEENITWTATVAIKLVAKYMPDPEHSSYFQTLYLTINSREVTGIEWQDNGDNYRIATTPFISGTIQKWKQFLVKTLPYDNTKAYVLENIPITQTNPFSADTSFTGLLVNQIRPTSAVNGTFNLCATTHGDWVIKGYLDAFSSNPDYGTVSKNTYGKMTQASTPSTSNIVYPKVLTLYDPLVSTPNPNNIEFYKIDDTYVDSYIVDTSGEEVTKTIFRKVGKWELSSSAQVNFDTGSTFSGTSVCFYLTNADKADTAGLNKIMCSHFAASETDIRTTGSDDTIINHSADQKIYIRIANSAIGVTDITSETEETLKTKITAYITAQYSAGTPITIWYPLANASQEEEEYENPLYYDNVFFTTKTYHIYSANNPANQCSVEFVNNATTIADDNASRMIFGQYYGPGDENDKNIENLMVDNIRSESTEISQVKFFSGTPTSINQYDVDGNLLLKADGTAEKGEINIWENFSGKYEEWTDDEACQVNYDIVGDTSIPSAVPSPDEPVYPVGKTVYQTVTTPSGSTQPVFSDPYEFNGYTWNGTKYLDSYSYSTKQVTSNFGKIEFDGTESIGTSGSERAWIKSDSASIYYNPGDKLLAELKGWIICSHVPTTTVNCTTTVGYPDMITDRNYGGTSTSGAIILNLSYDTINTGAEEEGTALIDSTCSNAQLLVAAKAYLARQNSAGTPVTVYYPKNASTIVGQDKTFYTLGNVHRKYTISKLLNEDGTQYSTDTSTAGQVTKINTFNKAFVFNKDKTIPSQFFMSRFIPGWNQDDNTGTLSMASGLKAQQRALNLDTITDDKLCYYKDSNDELQPVNQLYYGPLMAYTWLAYITYGTLNLKNKIGLGASKIGVEAQIFADDSGSLLTPGVEYASLYIINNGSLTADTYQNYDFNIVGREAAEEIATEPLTSYKIRSITVGDVYSVITLGDLSGNATTYTAKTATDYYSINSCYSTTGYSERNYLDSSSNVAISGFGTSANKTKYNDNKHPVRCLNIENMWGGGSYNVDGTGFTADTEDNTIMHPMLWNPEVASQDLDDRSTWETEVDTDVLTDTGTYDLGSFKYTDEEVYDETTGTLKYTYQNARCGWANEKAGEKIANRGYNVYGRKTSYTVGQKYNWVTGTYNDYSDSTDYQSMCGLGHTNAVNSNGKNVAGYSAIEYFETTAVGQYINTGVTLTGDGYEIDVKYSSTNISNQNIWGVQPVSGGAVFATFSGALYCQPTSTAPSGRSRTVYTSGTHDLDIKAENGSITYTIDNGIPITYSLGTTTSFDSTLFGSKEMWLCNQLVGDTYTASRNFIGKIYKFIVKKNGNYVFAGYPAIRQIDSVVGMIDVISGTFYSNAGDGGVFTAGPSISWDDIDFGKDTRYYALDKLSVDNQLSQTYIDSGSKLSQNVKLKVDFISNHTSSTKSYFGGSFDGTTGNYGLNVYIGTDNKLYLDRTSPICLSGETTILPETRHTIEVSNSSSGLTASIDGTQTYSGTQITNLDTSYNYFLFAVDNVNLPRYTQSFTGTIYSFELYKNGRQIRNYAAAYDKKDEKFGLYDKKNKKFVKLVSSTAKRSITVRAYFKNSSITEMTGINIYLYKENELVSTTPYIFGGITIKGELGAKYKIVAQPYVTLDGETYFNPVYSNQEFELSNDGETCNITYSSTATIDTLADIKAYLAVDTITTETKRERLVAHYNQSEDDPFMVNVEMYHNGTTAFTMPHIVLEINNYEQKDDDGNITTFLGAKMQPLYAWDSVVWDQREQVRASGEIFSADLYYYSGTSATAGSDQTFTALTAGTDYTVGASVDTWETEHSGSYIYKHSYSENQFGTGNLAMSYALRYGLNIYSQSNIHQWLNADSMTNWFKADHVGDICNYTTKIPYQYWFKNKDDLDVIRNNVAWGVYEIPNATLTDNKLWTRFVLPSGTEFAGSVNTGYEGDCTDYWKYLNGGTISNSANSNRTMKKWNAQTNTQYMWFRSPLRSNSRFAWHLYPSGNFSCTYVSYSLTVAPLFII